MSALEKEKRELIERYKLTDDILQQSCSEADLLELEQFIDWERVGPRLHRIDEIAMKDIEKNCTKEHEKRRELINIWRERNGEDANYCDMIEAMLKAQRRDQAQKVCRLLNPDPPVAESEIGAESTGDHAASDRVSGIELLPTRQRANSDVQEGGTNLPDSPATERRVHESYSDQNEGQLHQFNQQSTDELHSILETLSIGYQASQLFPDIRDRREEMVGQESPPHTILKSPNTVRESNPDCTRSQFVYETSSHATNRHHNNRNRTERMTPINDANLDLRIRQLQQKVDRLSSSLPSTMSSSSHPSINFNILSNIQIQSNMLSCIIGFSLAMFIIAFTLGFLLAMFMLR